MLPGKEGKITLAIDNTSGMTGEISKSATVTTNDPSRPVIVLVLRARFEGAAKPGQPAASGLLTPSGKRVGPFAIAPTDRWVAGVIRGSSAHTTINVVNVLDAPVRVTRIEPGGSAVAVTLNSIEEGKRYDLSLATDPALRPGNHLQVLRLFTDHSSMPEIAISLEVNVFPLVFATPKAIRLSPLPLTRGDSTPTLPVIYVRKIREGTMSIKSAVSSLPFVTVAVKPQSDGRLFEVRLQLDWSKIPGPGEFSGRIEIETDDTETPLLEVPVQGSFTQSL